MQLTYPSQCIHHQDLLLEIHHPIATLEHTHQEQQCPPLKYLPHPYSRYQQINCNNCQPTFSF